MNPFDSYMLNKVRRFKDARTRSAATGETPVGPVEGNCDIIQALTKFEKY